MKVKYGWQRGWYPPCSSQSDAHGCYKPSSETHSELLTRRCTRRGGYRNFLCYTLTFPTTCGSDSRRSPRCLLLPSCRIENRKSDRDCKHSTTRAYGSTSRGHAAHPGALLYSDGGDSCPSPRESPDRGGSKSDPLPIDVREWDISSRDSMLEQPRHASGRLGMQHLPPVVLSPWQLDTNPGARRHIVTQLRILLSNL